MVSTFSLHSKRASLLFRKSWGQKMVVHQKINKSLHQTYLCKRNSVTSNKLNSYPRQKSSTKNWWKFSTEIMGSYLLYRRWSTQYQPWVHSMFHHRTVCFKRMTYLETIYILPAWQTFPSRWSMTLLRQEHCLQLLSANHPHFFLIKRVVSWWPLWTCIQLGSVAYWPTQ